MNLNELRNLDPANIGGWPAPIKAILILLLCVAVLGAGYWFDTQDQIASLEQARAQEQSLKDEFVRKQAQAASLEPLKRQLEEMKQSFGALLRLLPNKTEVEGLLVDISQAGLAAGLEFELFKPQGEQKQEFIATLPIQIRVTGSYHEFGQFISAVAALPRIVTQHDIAISPQAGARAETSGAGEPQLVMTMVAQTYRYLEEDEIEEAQGAASAAGRRRKS
ncbi:MAG: type 4a pilus biogenesis protein PilO [Ectothiorhodospiraceae bacterium]|nr:type 4a pilus biogenesis protein PilO [Chromatiales bacterium]MCP5156470.1 type 4a pilus biogenesis protein PilO [Ectothiorhodospiraceae bacterium]